MPGHENHEPLILITVHAFAIALILPVLGRLCSTPGEWWIAFPALLFGLLPFIAIMLVRFGPPQWRWTENAYVGVVLIDVISVCLVWTIALAFWAAGRL